MSDTKRLFVRLGAGGREREGSSLSLPRAAYWLLLSLGNVIRAAMLAGPGAGFHVSALLGAVRLLRSDLARSQVYRLMVAPMDSVRYFEFDFLWKRLCAAGELGDYLDVSSPRLFTWRALCSGRARHAVMANPDREDLAVTAGLFAASGCAERCDLRQLTIEELPDAPGSFDTVVSISVLEHIPAGAAQDALRKLWDFVRPGGRLLLSVPCAREAFEEYVDFNEYRLLEPGAEGYVFGQRFYDHQMLQAQIYSVLGNPVASAIYGEKECGAFFRDRERKLTQRGYPFWREPWMMATEYGYFEDVRQLPGIGVIAFEFVKP